MRASVPVDPMVRWSAAVLAAVLVLTLAPATTLASDDGHDWDVMMFTYGCELNQGNYTPYRDVPEPDRYTYKAHYWANGGFFIMKNDWFVRVSMSGFSDIWLNSISDRHVSGPNPDDNQYIVLHRGMYLAPAPTMGRQWKFGPGRIGLGVVLDVPGFSDGRGDTTWGFEGGGVTWYALRFWRAILMGSLSVSWFALTHPFEMTGGRFEARLDAYVPLGKLKWTAKKYVKLWLWVGAGYQGIGYKHPEEPGQEPQPDVDMDAASMRFGLGLDWW